MKTDGNNWVTCRGWVHALAEWPLCTAWCPVDQGLMPHRCVSCMGLWGSLRKLSSLEVKPASKYWETMDLLAVGLSIVSSYFFSFCVFSPGMRMRIPVVQASWDGTMCSIYTSLQERVKWQQAKTSKSRKWGVLKDNCPGFFKKAVPQKTRTR